MAVTFNPNKNISGFEKQPTIFTALNNAANQTSIFGNPFANQTKPDSLMDKKQGGFVYNG